jgi:tRNA/rRNA methyltransferase
MRNFGFRKLWLVEPYDKAFRDARSAAGAADVLRAASVTTDLAEALGEASLVVGTSSMKNRSEDFVQRALPTGATALRAHLQTKPAALLFGSEKYGLRKRDLSFCDWLLTVPTDPRCPSMNLGQATAVCCYELARHARMVPALQTPANASAEDRDRILRMLVPVLETSGFVRAASRDKQIQKLRRWVGRLRLAPRDSRLLQGMLRQIQWKLDHP